MLRSAEAQPAARKMFVGVCVINSEGLKNKPQRLALERSEGNTARLRKS